MSEAHRSDHERAAEVAVKALDRAKTVGAEVGLFGALTPPEERKRGPNKLSAKLSAYLAAMGYQSPSEALFRHAGLHLHDDPAVKAMAMADMIEAWACRDEVGEDGRVLRFSPEERRALAVALMGEQRKANEALMPYVAKKLTPDVAVTTAQQVVFMGSQKGGRAPYAPPPLPGKKEAQKQEVIEGEIVKSEDVEFED